MTGPDIPDQRAHWDRMYEAGDVSRRSPSAFAQFSAPIIAPASTILELGCGSGADAVWFARAGHAVTATDFSATVIARNLRQFRENSNLAFRLADTAYALPFADEAFNVVYAHLSLHYFPRDVTIRTFGEIRRVLKTGGRLMFLCKSTADSLHGQGVSIEPDMYLRDGHLRHFFSEALVRACLVDRFTLDVLEEGRSALYEGQSPSAWLRVIATAL